MTSVRRVCVVNNGHLAEALKGAGHDVLALSLSPGIHDIALCLSEYDFTPDILIEVESLGPRVVLTGLEQLPCVRAYWSIDTHLNAWWHGYYGRLFDVVFTTQADWVEPLKAYGLKNVHWLPWYAEARSYRPWAERSHNLGFVGRITKARPIRKRLVRLLEERYVMAFYEDIHYSRLFDCYAAIRIAPNESILREVNFRLFEAASVGCLVVNERGRSDISPLFVPDREILEYSDVLELEEKLTFALQHQDAAETMARAAWERVQKEHLLPHRVESMMQVLSRAERVGASGDCARLEVARTLSLMWEAGILRGDVAHIIARLKAHAETPDVTARLLRFLYLVGERREVRELCLLILENGVHAAHFDVNFAGGMVALALGEHEFAGSFWYRQSTHSGAKLTRAKNPASMYRLWAGECRKRGMLVRAGLPFTPQTGLPETALECLLCALDKAPDDVALFRELYRVTGMMDGVLEGHLGYASALSLREPENWRLGIELALVNFRAMRPQEGEEELLLAYDRAKSQGRETAFFRFLSGKDTTGRVMRLMHQKGELGAGQGVM